MFFRRSCAATQGGPVDRLVHSFLSGYIYRKGIWVEIEGARFLVDYAYRGLHDYEPNVFKAFLDAVRPGMTVLDVGAHIGLYTLGAASRLQGRGKLVAFEPAPIPHRILARHVSLNGYSSFASALPLAVSDFDGDTELFAQGGGTIASLRRDHAMQFSFLDRKVPVTSIRVPCVRLDSFCAREYLKPDLLKIDVEGLEYQVLSGSVQILDRHRPAILCEIHPSTGASQSAAGDVFSLANDLGYQTERLTSPNEFGIYHVMLRGR